MSITTHERPGVYSSYGASSLIRGSGGRKTVGLVAVNTKATAKTVYTITSYEEAVTTFGSAGGQDMAELIRVILLNGAAATLSRRSCWSVRVVQSHTTTLTFSCPSRTANPAS